MSALPLFLLLLQRIAITSFHLWIKKQNQIYPPLFFPMHRHPANIHPPYFLKEIFN